MPFPWKKSRVSRISRIVADLQSPKRGNSLVVETGFPTSLVDLFVKNRDKLKRPFKRKKQKVRSQRLVEEDEIVISDPVLVTNSRELDDVLEQNQALEARNLEEEREIFVGSEPVSHDDENLHGGHANENENKNGRRVFMLGSLVMFMVLALGLTTKKLAVAITTSAFVLIFLEHLGNYVLCLSKPCLSRRTVSGTLMRRLFFLLPPERVVPISKHVKNCGNAEKGIIVLEEDGFSFHSGDMVDALDHFNCCMEEIQVLESVISEVEVNSNVENNMHLLSNDKELGNLEAKKLVRVVEVDGDRTTILTSVKECSRQAKIRTKMRMLVPKKLREGKKWKRSKGKESDAGNVRCLEADKVEVREEEQTVDPQGLEIAGKSLAFLLTKEEEGDREKTKKQIQVVDHVRRGVEAEAETILVGEILERRMAIQRKDNSSYPMFFIIILAGLMGGRIVAFSLTVGWCLALKLFMRCRRSVKSQ
ncbi:hypothetical protein K2173_000367 [Erythroxylum novogranatense]|uniref:Uncharacterized protein n=1 Tax=Erythroxylum novogranatense TaxID=1862640 RepID=A0AAV8SW35_9ROSI|nr:hypothetical protein K2173_000367 [Erythroxylum novogranatense]